MSFKNRGTMSEDDRTRIRCNYCFLTEELSVEFLLDHMVSQLIITDDDVDEINSEKTRRRRVEMFLKILQNSGPQAYSAFISCLQKDYKHVAKRLEATDLTLAERRERGGVGDKEKNILQSNWCYIAAEIRPKDLVAQMYQFGLLCEDEKDFICNMEDTEGRAKASQKLVEILSCAGKNALKKFLCALNETHYDGVYKKLKCDAEKAGLFTEGEYS